METSLLRAELHWHGLDQLARRDHVFGGFEILPEVWRCNVRLIRCCVGIDLEESKAGRICLLRHRVDRQHPRFDTHRDFHLLPDSPRVRLEMLRCDLELRDSYYRSRRSYCAARPGH